jgi:hypothetical protein
VAVDYIAHIFRVPPGVSLTAKDNQFLVVPLAKGTKPGLRVTINSTGHRPTKYDEICWPSVQDKQFVYLINRQARIKALDDNITFLSIIYIGKSANVKAESSFP